MLVICLFLKKYFLIIESTKDIDLSNVKKNKFTIIFRNQHIKEKIGHLKI